MLRMAGVAGFLLFSGAVSADDKALDVDCRKMERVAEFVMTERQRGIPMSRAMEKAKGSELREMLIIDAYEKRHYAAKSDRDWVVSEFKDAWYLVCVKAVREAERRISK